MIGRDALKVCDAARARRKPFVAWDQLPDEKRQRLIAVAERLELEYAAAGDPPSRGLPADEPEVEVVRDKAETKQEES